MKLFRLLIIASLLLTSIFPNQLSAQAQTNCIEDFENETPTGLMSSVGNWQTQNGQVAFELDTGTNGTMILRGNDGSGSSNMFNDVDYNGDWLDQGCQFCFDIRYVAGSSNPATGVNAVFIQGAGFSARFTVNTPIGPDWVRVCAPIELSDGTNLPSNAEGQWGGSLTAADWDALIQSVTRISFALDFAGGSNPAENVYVDNLCYEPCPDSCATVIRETVVCDDNGDFTYTFSVENNTGQTVNGIIIDGVYYPSVTIAPGGIYGPVTFNLPGSAAPSYCFDVILFTEDLECCHIEHCVDLVCDPCVDIIDQSIRCLPDGNYEYCMAIQNNHPTNDATHVYFDVYSPGGLQFTPNSVAVLIPAGGGVATVCVTIPGPLAAGTLVEFKTTLKNQSGELDDWCCSRDGFSVVIPECEPVDCTCEDFEAHVAAGFTHVFNCPNGIFTPRALLPCDKVSWYVNGVQITPATIGTNPFQYTYPGPGTYEVCMEVIRTDLVNQIECIDRYCEIIEIREWCEEGLRTVDIYPNPVRDQLVVDLGSDIPSGPLNLRILGSDGQTVVQEVKNAAQNITVDLSNLTDGIYFLSIEGENFRSSNRFMKLK